MYYAVWNDRTGERLGVQIDVARSFWARLFGLAGRRYLPMGTGLFLPGCSSVHTHFMRVPLDLIYLDASGRVLAVRRRVMPWRAPGRVPGTVDLLELPSGCAGMARVGDRLHRAPLSK
ncbi:MAG TPA: DUF192 domain-containing protein [Symbiobacteriaceae bacterium]|nr:DUF192 domain-containing protein [Symbiobacteriaceae bacterium]